MESVQAQPHRVSSYFASWCIPHLITDDPQTKKVSLIFLAASYLTDPICKVREYFWQMAIVDQLEQATAKTQRLAKKLFFFLGILACGVVSIFTTLPGIGLRYVGCQIQKEPFIHLKGEPREKTCVFSEDLKLLSWNVCCPSAGYSITDGGVVPWVYRIDGIAQAIKLKEPDVACLYEVFDLSAAFYLYEQLKGDFAHFYFNIGPSPMGVSSGMLVTSKYPIQNPRFVPFSKDDLVDRTQYACKGVFTFDLVSGRIQLAQIHATHLQHSEEPGRPTPDEKKARKKEMEAVIRGLEREKPFPGVKILTGDLNMDDEELKAQANCDQFSNGRKGFLTTWGGDKACVELVNRWRIKKKQVSKEMNLDYTLLVKELDCGQHETWNLDRAKTPGFNDCKQANINNMDPFTIVESREFSHGPKSKFHTDRSIVKKIKTEVFDSSYQATRFNKRALSDHHMLLSRIKIKNCIQAQILLLQSSAVN